jgi:hypothetical protein
MRGLDIPPWAVLAEFFYCPPVIQKPCLRSRPSRDSLDEQKALQAVCKLGPGGQACRLLNRHPAQQLVNIEQDLKQMGPQPGSGESKL